MINQGNVSTATTGGHPNDQPMAAIGGVQSAEVLPVEELQAFTNEAIGSRELISRTSQVQNLLGLLASNAPMLPYATDDNPSTNFSDNTAQHDKSSTPLPFTVGFSADWKF